MTKREKELTQQVERLTKMVDELLQKLEAAEAKIVKQDAEIAKLKEQLNKNSRNSSKPPSSDGFNKSNRSLRESSGKKPGGQKGHKGHNLQSKIRPTAVIQHMPHACIVCPISQIHLRGSFPEDIKAPIQYGDNLQAMVVALSTVGAVSAARIHEIFGGIFNIPLSKKSQLFLCSGNVYSPNIV